MGSGPSSRIGSAFFIVKERHFHRYHRLNLFIWSVAYDGFAAQQLGTRVRMSSQLT